MKETMFWILAGLLFLGALGVAAFYDPALPRPRHEVEGQAVEGRARAGRVDGEAEAASPPQAQVAIHPCRWEETCVALCGHGRQLCCEGRWACPAPGAPGWEHGPLAASSSKPAP